MSSQTHQSASVMPASGHPRPTIQRFTLGPYETNCYVVIPGSGGHPSPIPGTPCWIIDASFEPAPIVEFIRSRGLKPQALILTHAHIDHIAGVREVVAAFHGLPVLIHEAEREWLTDPLLNLSSFSGMPVTAPEASRLLQEGDELVLGGDAWSVLHTPGHSPGGITLYHAPSKTAIVGDALFSGSIGRTDFPGADHATLVRSIKTKLYTLPENVRILPGHGPESTIGRERLSNPFVRG